MNDNQPPPPPAQMVRIVGTVVGERVIPNQHFPRARRPVPRVAPSKA